MNQRPDLDLLDRFLAGTASEPEATAIRRWLVAQPADILAATRAELAEGQDGWDVDAAWRRVQPRLGEPAAEIDAAATPALRLIRPAPRHPWRRLALAGAGLAAAAAAVLVWRGTFGPATGGVAGPLAEVTTPAGQSATLRLADGTTVRLDAGSRLRYPSRQAPGAARELILEGRAWFEVAHDPARPFRVRAGGALVQDLGTEFTVAADPGAGVRVVVVRGRVSVAAAPMPGRPARADPGAPQGRKARTLGAGEMAHVDSLGAVVVSTVDVAPWLAWTRGVLAFDARPLREVAAELGRWYGVEIRVGDAALARRTVTAEFRGEPLERVLDAIALTLGARWERVGGTVTFRAGVRP